MKNETLTGHGGKRPGAGRPKAPASIVLRLRMPVTTYNRIKALGGDIWAKRIINEALEKAK